MEDTNNGNEIENGGGNQPPQLEPREPPKFSRSQRRKELRKLNESIWDGASGMYN